MPSKKIDTTSFYSEISYHGERYQLHVINYWFSELINGVPKSHGVDVQGKKNYSFHITCEEGVWKPYDREKGQTPDDLIELVGEVIVMNFQ